MTLIVASLLLMKSIWNVCQCACEMTPPTKTATKAAHAHIDDDILDKTEWSAAGLRVTRIFYLQLQQLAHILLCI